MDALNDLGARHDREHADHRRALEDAARKGTADPKGKRTPAEKREAELQDARERVWAAALALAEFADWAVVTLREKEPVWLAALSGRAGQAAEKPREAALLLEVARQEEYRLKRLATWLMNEVDGIGFSRQSAPGLSPARPRSPA